MGWLRKKAKQIGKGIKKIGSKIAGAVRKVTRSKAFKVVAAIALATIVGPAAWSTWGAGGSGTFLANLSAQTAAVTGGAFGSTLAQQQAAAQAANISSQLAITVPEAFASGTTASAASGTAAQQLAATVPTAFSSGTAAAGTGTAASQLAVTVPASITPIINEAAVATAANASTPNIFARVGSGIQNFANKNPFVSGVAGSVVGGVALGAINAKLAGDPELQGVQVGESAQERSALAELYSGYQAKYGSNAVKEYMLGMNFGYDSVGYQTTV